MGILWMLTSFHLVLLLGEMKAGVTSLKDGLKKEQERGMSLIALLRRRRRRRPLIWFMIKFLRCFGVAGEGVMVSSWKEGSKEERKEGGWEDRQTDRQTAGRTGCF